MIVGRLEGRASLERHRLGLTGSAAEVIEAHRRDDAQEPGPEGRIPAELAEAAIRLEETVLVDVTRLVLRPHQPEGQPQHAPVVHPDERLESGPVTGLGLGNQRGFVGWRHEVVILAWGPISS